MTTYLTIGEFSQRTRLSPKALRLYGELGVLLPGKVDPDSGYRFYREDQIEPARLVGLLRRLDMPLATIGELLALEGDEAAQALARWWAEVDAVRSERSGLVAYVQARLRGEEHTVYDIDIRRLPERRLISINRHVDASGTEAFFAEGFTKLRAAGRGLPGIAGVPFLVFYGDVSDDSDGPDRALPAGRGSSRRQRPPAPGRGSTRRGVHPPHAEGDGLARSPPRR